MTRSLIASIPFVFAGLLAAQVPETQDRPGLEERLTRTLERFPQSDANRDGTLTREEAVAFLRSRGESMEKRGPRGGGRPGPTHADVSYGGQEKQAFDLWLVPDAVEPTPLILFIHGGGFRGGDKAKVSAAMIEKCIRSGVAFASMNYRLSDIGPFPIMMEDAARGLQTIRHRASEWNIDPKMIACCGGSAGAGISLWLGFHDDLADPESQDPIARQSTRIVAAATMNGQSTYDMRTFREWFGVPDLEPDPALPAFYGILAADDWESERVRKLMTEASAMTHLTKDDVPVYMTYSRPNSPVTAETPSSEWVHHVKLGLMLKEEMEKLGLECVVRGPDVIPENDRYGTLEDFLIAKVKGQSEGQTIR